MSMPVTFDRRVLARRDVSLKWHYIDADGVPAAAPATPTVAVTNLDGQSVTVGPVTSTSGDGDQAPLYSATVAAADNPQPDVWTVTWTVSGESFVDTVEVVGGFILDLDTFRLDRPGSRRRTLDFTQARVIAEREIERVTRTRFAPAAAKIRVPAPRRNTTTLVTPLHYLRAVRSVTDSDGVAFDATALANLDPTPAGTIRRTDRSAWPITVAWFDLVVEYGLTTAPPEVVEAAVRRMEFWASRTSADLPAWATSYTVDGLNATFRTASGDRWHTGDPVVDSLLADWAARAHDPAIA